MSKPNSSPTRTGSGLIGACVVGVTLPLAGCSSTGARLTEPSPAYLRALEQTFGTGASPMEEQDLTAAIGRVTAMFADFTEENLRRSIPEVYAEQLFFRDGFKQFTRREPLQDYMLRSTAPLRSCSFDFEPPMVAGPDVYLRWVMNVSLLRDQEEQVERVIGMSHLRFNEAGQVVFQQDYWDPTDVLYRRIPVANWLIGKVKARL